MGKFSSQYKQTGPTRRIVSGENTYERGMQFSEHPLPAGAVHTLLNLEVNPTDFSLSVSGGLHTTDVAAGCNYFDRAIFGGASQRIIVLQGRNEYCMRAFEGITNIVSIQKLAVKNNQTLTEELRQQGFTASNVLCYKLLTYNPFNHRLMSVTLIQAPRDKHFVVSPNYKLRRLQANPISCGFSEVWSDSEGEKYVSNITDNHPQGASDYYIPRVRRNSFDETYGQILHSPHFMQTVVNCEGFGNKTFLFTKKKQKNIEGPLIDTTEIETKELYTPWSVGISTQGIEMGDYIYVTPDRVLEAYEEPRVYYKPVVETGQDPPLRLVSPGAWEWSGELDDSFRCQIQREGNTVIPSFFSFRVLDYTLRAVIVGNPNTQHDIYLRNCNTGTDKNLSAQAVINTVPVPVDAYRFGIIMTSVVLKFTYDSILPPTLLDPDNLYTASLIPTIKQNASLGPNWETPLEVDLNNGKLRFREGGGTMHFCPLPPIRGEETVVSDPADTVSGLFKSTGIVFNNGAGWVHPADSLNDYIKASLRIGQGFRFAVFAKSVVPLTRLLNTLREDPLKSDYYNETPSAVFVLDYVWNGAIWEFSFLDTSKAPDLLNPTLVENWESSEDTRDALGNRITRHYIWVNRLSYTDIITPENQGLMAEHLVDHIEGLQKVYSVEEETLYSSNAPFPLTYNINTTLNTYLDTNVLENRSKVFDTAFGHFDVTPRELSPSEAARWGYNMLSPTPYLFKCSNTPGREPLLAGLTLMRNGEPLLKPLLNMEGVLYIYFSCDQAAIAAQENKGYQLILEYKNPFDEWHSLKEFSVTDTHATLVAGTPFQVPFTSAYETPLIRMQLLDRDTQVNVALADGTTEEHFFVVSAITTALTYTKDPVQVEVGPRVYDLGSALGITYWKSRLVAWGVLGAENQIFLSEASQPEYWPYPTNTDLFEENIVHITPYSDALIVFTSTKIWRLDMLSDGLSWRKTLIQQNLRIIDKDIPYICTLKNMLFFKSDKQFYMLVPQKGSTVGDVTIAPVSKPIQEFLMNPFSALKKIIPRTYKDLTDKGRPINEYLIKYSTHVEQMKVFINWWFDLTAFQNQEEHFNDRAIQHEVLKASNTDDNPVLLPKEYWLVQLVYDAQLYSWALHTHTTNAVGSFISDAANANPDFVSLVFTPEITTATGTPLFTDTSGKHYSKACWGVNIAHRKTTEDTLLQQFTLEKAQIIVLKSTYPRFQVLDTGYKEITTPALLKRFREAQLFVQPKGAKEAVSEAPVNWLQQLIDYSIPEVAEEPDLITPFMHSEPVEATTGNAVALKALLDVYVDGHHILSSAKPEVKYDPVTSGVLQIKIIDTFAFIESPFTVDAELSNTFLLDQSALEGVKLIRFRKTVNGKGQLIRMRFVNLTETNYALLGHAFVAHNKNAR